MMRIAHVIRRACLERRACRIAPCLTRSLSGHTPPLHQPTMNHTEKTRASNEGTRRIHTTSTMVIDQPPSLPPSPSILSHSIIFSELLHSLTHSQSEQESIETLERLGLEYFMTHKLSSFEFQTLWMSLYTTTCMKNKIQSTHTIAGHHRRRHRVSEQHGSWSSNRTSRIIQADSPFGQTLIRLFNEIDVELTRLKSSNSNHLHDAKISSIIQYFWNLCLGLRQSRLFDLMSFSTTPNEFGLGNLTHHHAEKFGRYHLLKHGFLTCHLESPEYEIIKELNQTRVQPFIIETMVNIFERHIDVILVPNSTFGEDTQAHAHSTPPPPLSHIDLTHSSFTNFEGPFPSSSIPSNILRVASFLHSFRHLYSGGRLFNLLLHAMTCDLKTLRKVCQQRSSNAAQILLSESKALNIRRPTHQKAEKVETTTTTGTIVHVSDTLFYTLSLPDLIYVLQLIAIHQLNIGLSTPLMVIRRILHDRLDAIVEGATLIQLARIIESFGQLEMIDYIPLAHFLDTTMNRLQLPQLHDLERGLDDASINDIRTTLSKPVEKSSFQTCPQRYTFQPSYVQRNLYHRHHDGMIDHGQLLHTIFVNYVKCAKPILNGHGGGSTDAERWSTWRWTSSQLPRDQSPMRMARLLCIYYETILDSYPTNEFQQQHPRHEYLLDTLIHFSWSLICVEFERYTWSLEFFRKFITWIETYYRIVQTDDKMKTKTTKNRFSNTMNQNDGQVKKMKLIHIATGSLMSMSLTHKLHQISIALDLRVAIKDGRNTTPLTDDDTLDDSQTSNIRFTTPFYEYFRQSRSIGNLFRVSSFQQTIYRLLSDTNGPFAFDKRVIHTHSTLSVDQQPTTNLIRIGSDDTNRSPVDDVDTRRPTQPTLSRTIDLFVEHCTEIGYIVDAAIIESYPHQPQPTRLGNIPSIADAINRSSLSPTSSPTFTYSYVALEIDGPFHFRRGIRGILTSSTELRKKQLRLNGWNVISISFEQWNRFKTKKEQIEYLMSVMPKRLLKETTNTK